MPAVLSHIFAIYFRKASWRSQPDFADFRACYEPTQLPPRLGPSHTEFNRACSPTQDHIGRKSGTCLPTVCDTKLHRPICGLVCLRQDNNGLICFKQDSRVTNRADRFLAHNAATELFSSRSIIIILVITYHTLATAENDTSEVV